MIPKGQHIFMIIVLQTQVIDAGNTRSNKLDDKKGNTIKGQVIYKTPYPYIRDDIASYIINVPRYT